MFCNSSRNDDDINKFLHRRCPAHCTSSIHRGQVISFIVLRVGIATLQHKKNKLEYTLKCNGTFLYDKIKENIFICIHTFTLLALQYKNLIIFF